MSKIYCYVDESGQHTHGDFFSVSVVIAKTIEMRDEAERMLLEIERRTEKGSAKWTKTHHRKKARYLRTIATVAELKNCLFYSILHRYSGLRWCNCGYNSANDSTAGDRCRDTYELIVVD